MDPHANEAAAAVAATGEMYGTSAGTWDGYKRRWELNDCVMFYHKGELNRGHIMAIEDGVERDTYRIRRHVIGGGTEVVEVFDRAILPY